MTLREIKKEGISIRNVMGKKIARYKMALHILLAGNFNSEISSGVFSLCRRPSFQEMFLHK